VCEDRTADGSQKEAQMEDSTAAAAQALVARAADRVGVLARELSAWALEEGRTLGEVEQQTLALVKEFGQLLLTGVCAVVAAGTPAREQSCPCGAAARYVRQRPAQVLTVLGTVSITRAYYHCLHCGHGHAPLDRQLGYCAGSTSAGLEEVLALLGATADSFEEAVTLLGVSCSTVARWARIGRLPATRAIRSRRYEVGGVVGERALAKAAADAAAVRKKQSDHPRAGWPFVADAAAGIGISTPCGGSSTVANSRLAATATA